MSKSVKAPKIYKFVVTDGVVTMYEPEHGAFEAVTLAANETLAFDPATGNITKTEVLADHLDIDVFAPTADTTDDATLYTKASSGHSGLDGSPISSDDDRDDDGSIDDHIRGGSDDDVEHGGRGRDRIDGGKGHDDISGDDGDDKLSGGSGDDSLHGGNGSDHLSGGEGADDLSGGADDDSASGGNGDDSIHGDDGDDHVRGGNGADDLSGDDGDDDLSGGNDDDSLHGGHGADDLSGGAGDDHLEGGHGKDDIRGGLGADTFVFTTDDFAGATRQTAERIRDFSHAQGDKIDFSGVDADSLTDGDQAFSFIGNAAFGNHAGELRYEIVRSNAFVSGDTNGDGVADFTIRLDHVATLDVTDFVL